MADRSGTWKEVLRKVAAIGAVNIFHVTSAVSLFRAEKRL